MKTLIDIIIGILIWQLLSTILLYWNEDSTTFKIILCGIPLLFLWVIGYPFRKTDFFNRIRYFRCSKKITENGKTEAREYYCTVHDERHAYVYIPGSKKKCRMSKEWFVQNTRYVTRKEIRREGLKYWKDYRPLEEEDKCMK